MTFLGGKALCYSVAAALAVALAFPATAKVLASVDGVDITDDDVAIAMMDDIGPTLPGTTRRGGLARPMWSTTSSIWRLGLKEGRGRQLPEYSRFRAPDGLLSRQGPDAGSARQSGHRRDDRCAADEKSLRRCCRGPMRAQPEIHARHILVATEDEAKAALARIKNGEDSQRRSPGTNCRRIRAPRAAISAGSPRTRWCRNSPTPPSG